MLKVIKAHWKLLLISIIAIPIVVNFIIYCPAPFPKLVVESTKEWLSFFTTFIGTLIGALVSFAILYKTIEQNHQENEKNRTANQEENRSNRDLQIKTIKYQMAKDDLNILINCLAKYKASCDFVKLAGLPYHAISRESYQTDTQLLRQLVEESISSYNILMINLSLYENEDEMKFKKELEIFKTSYEALLRDVTWFLGETLLSKTEEEFKEISKKYMNYEMSYKDYVDTIRIWTLVEKYGFNIWQNKCRILEEYLLSFDFNKMRKLIEDFIKYEKSKLDKMLEEL